MYSFKLSFSMREFSCFCKFPQLHILSKIILFSPNFSVIIFFNDLMNLLLSNSELNFLFLFSFFLPLVYSSGSRPKVLKFFKVLILLSTLSDISLFFDIIFFNFISSKTWFSNPFLKSITLLLLFKLFKSISLFELKLSLLYKFLLLSD